MPSTYIYYKPCRFLVVEGVEGDDDAKVAGVVFGISVQQGDCPATTVNAAASPGAKEVEQGGWEIGVVNKFRHYRSILGMVKGKVGAEDTWKQRDLACQC